MKSRLALRHYLVGLVSLVYLVDLCLRDIVHFIQLVGTGPAGPNTRMDTVTDINFFRNRQVDF
jgi:hypothetical protein